MLAAPAVLACLRAAIALLLLASLAWMPTASAQGAGTAPAGEAVSVEALQSLVDTLENDQERKRLVGQLQLLIRAQAQADEDSELEKQAKGLGALLLATLSEQVNGAAGHLREAVDAVTDLPQMLTGAWEAVKRPAAQAQWLATLGKVLLILAVGLIAEWFALRLLARPRRMSEDRTADSLPFRLLFLLVRTMLDLVPIAAFVAAAYVALSLVEPSRVTRLIALTVINANLLARIGTALARMILAPNVAGLRLIPLADETANYVFIWVRRLTIIAVYGYFIAEAAPLVGLPPATNPFLLKATGLLLTSLMVVFILQNRIGVASWLRRDADASAPFSSVRNRLADIWHILLILYVVSICGVWLLELEGGFEFLIQATVLTVVVLVLARFLITALRRAMDRGFRLADEVRMRYPQLEARANRYIPALHRILRGVICAVAGLLLLDIWGLDIIAWLASDAGRRIGAHLITILLIIAAALLFWEVVNALIERDLRRRASAQMPERRTRLVTLLPLVRNVVRITLVAVVALIVLSEIGIDIGPLLAGAGVVGLAVGFGAQALVKDVITGAFILVEDSIAIGDVVEVGGHAGTVEAMSIRTLRIRDLNGDVHVVPFGEISTVLNKSRDFSFALMDVSVAYREDVDHVVEVLQQVAEELRGDPQFGPNILEPLHVMGLEQFADSAVIIRVRLKTKPLAQWPTRREFNRRMKRAFDEQGIEIPFPHQTIYFGEDRRGKAPPARVLLRNGDAAGSQEAKDAPRQPNGGPLLPSGDPQTIVQREAPAAS